MSSPIEEPLEELEGDSEEFAHLPESVASPEQPYLRPAKPQTAPATPNQAPAQAPTPTVQTPGLHAPGNTLAPDATSDIPGAPKLFRSNDPYPLKGSGPTPSSSTGSSPASGIGNKALDAAANNSETARTVRDLKKVGDAAKGVMDAANTAKTVGGLGTAAGEAATGVGIFLAAVTLAKTTWENREAIKKALPYLLGVYFLPPFIGALVLAVVFGPVIGNLLNNHKGDQPGQIGVAAGALLDGATHCDGMASELNVVDSSGKTHLLTLSDTQGGWSAEEAATTPGQLTRLATADPPVKKGFLHFNDLTRSNGSHGFSNAELDWYLTARWPDMAYPFRVSDAVPAHKIPGAVPDTLYGGRKLIVYNPKNGKAAVGISAESGPAPYTGPHAYQSAHDTPGSEAEEGNIWNSTNQGFGPGYLVHAPTDVHVLVVGGPQYPNAYPSHTSLGMMIGQYLGVDEGSSVVVGYAADQNLPLGPFTCKVAPKLASSTSAGTGNKVCLDPGHGGSANPGSGPFFGDFYERQATVDMALKLKTSLEAKGMQVIMTKTQADQFVDQHQRGILCNAAQLAIHLHTDSTGGSGNGSGFTVYVPDDKEVNDIHHGFSENGHPSKTVEASSHTAGQAFHEAYAGVIGSSLRDNGIRGDSQTNDGTLGFNVTSIIPTLTIEMFYGDSAHDHNWYASAAGKDKLLQALVAGTLAAAGHR